MSILESILDTLQFVRYQFQMKEKKLKEQNGNWKRMQFKNNKVWVQTDEARNPLVKNGKILIKYQLNQDYEYAVLFQNIKPLDAAGSTPKKKKLKKNRGKKRPGTILPDNAVCIFTDGASSGNPGPSGIGVLLKFGEHEKTISRYIGEATNNIAELEAIKVGLLEVRKKNLPVRVFTDSGYAYGLLALGWKAKKNQVIVESIRMLMPEFTDLEIIKVKGHAGEENNERADKLAVSAIKKRK